MFGLCGRSVNCLSASGGLLYPSVSSVLSPVLFAAAETLADRCRTEPPMARRILAVMDVDAPVTSVLRRAPFADALDCRLGALDMTTTRQTRLATRMVRYEEDWQKRLRGEQSAVLRHKICVETIR
jgi:hypothetical protein